MKLEQALELARRFHQGQLDKAGRPYLEHIMRVVNGVQTDDEKLVAAMHDLVEDTPLSFGDLICAGAPNRIVHAVEALTRQDGEDYHDFIGRAASDPIARPVKLADLADNSDEGRLALLEPEQAARLRAKYADALRFLQSLEPLSEADYAVALAAKTGTPVGATELGVSQDPSEMWATFWCDEEGCGRPSSTLTLVQVKNPDVPCMAPTGSRLTPSLGPWETSSRTNSSLLSERPYQPAIPASSTSSTLSLLPFGVSGVSATTALPTGK
jgi:hypothetical protein